MYFSFNVHGERNSGERVRVTEIECVCEANVREIGERDRNRK